MLDNAYLIYTAVKYHIQNYSYYLQIVQVFFNTVKIILAN